MWPGCLGPAQIVCKIGAVNSSNICSLQIVNVDPILGHRFSHHWWCSNFIMGTCEQMFSHWHMPDLRNKFVKNLSVLDPGLLKGVEDTWGLSCKEGGGIYWALQGFMFGAWERAGSVTVCIPLPWKEYADGIFFLVLWTCRHLGNSCSSLFSLHSAVSSGQQGCYRWQLKIRVVLSSSLQPASELSWQKGLLTDSWLLWKFRSWRAQGVNWNEVPSSVPSRVKTLILLSECHTFFQYQFWDQ